MTHLNIQQGLNIEVVSTNLIKKLYEAALSVPEPLEGELDAAYMSGNLLVDKSYRALVEYLTNRFDDLHINVTAGYYIPFHDSAVNDVLKNTIGDGIGVLESLLKAVNPDVNLGLNNNTNIVDARELCLIEGTNLLGDLFLMGCSNIKTIGIPCNLTYYRFLPAVTVDNIVVKNLTNYINANWANNAYSFYRNSSGWDLYTTTDGSNITKVENLTIPNDAVFSNSITQIPFYKCKSVKNVTVPSGITSLRGFNGSNILSVTFELNSALTSILNDCFYECSNLVFDVANLPLTITTIGNNAFRSCSNVTGVLDLPNLTSLGQSSFNGTGITGIANIGSITSIPDSCFYNCGNLTSVVLPANCISIENGAFANDLNLTTINLANITSMGGDGLSKTKITNVDMPSLLSITGYWAFANCTSLTTVTDLGSITNIPNGTFQNCTNLSKIKLPTTVTSLNDSWGKNISSTLYISGLDNVSNHSTNSWELTNTTILNPIKISLVTGGSIVSWSNNNSVVIRVHSYYEPLRTSTRQNSLAMYGAPRSTLFIYNCFGGTGSFTIGLLYYRDIASFGTATFFRCNIENLVINNSTPPVLDNSDTTLSGESYWLNWGNSIFGNQTSSSDPSLLEHAIIGTLWVPDSAVATYQADPLYSSLTIKGINTKTNGVDYDLPRYADFAAWEAAEEAAVAQGGHAPLGLIEAWM